MKTISREVKHYFAWLALLTLVSVVLMVANVDNQPPLRFVFSSIIHFCIGLWLRKTGKSPIAVLMYFICNIVYLLLNQIDPSKLSITFANPILYGSGFGIGLVAGYWLPQGKRLYAWVVAYSIFLAIMLWDGFAWMRFHISPMDQKSVVAFDRPMQHVYVLDTSGRVVPQQQVLQHPILISVYYNGCSACWKQHQQIEEVQKAVSSAGYRLDVAIVHSEKRESFTQFLQMLKRMDNRLPAWFDSNRVLSTRMYSEGAPLTYLLNRHGVVTKKYVGYYGGYGDNHNRWIREVTRQAINIAKDDGVANK